MWKEVAQVINLKPVRRQAYRYGQQMGALLELHGDTAVAPDVEEKIQTAYKAFLAQFDGYDAPEVIKDWLREEYARGFIGVDPLGPVTSRADLSLTALSLGDLHETH